MFVVTRHNKKKIIELYGIYFFNVAYFIVLTFCYVLDKVPNEKCGEGSLRSLKPSDHQDEYRHIDIKY